MLFKMLLPTICVSNRKTVPKSIIEMSKHHSYRLINRLNLTTCTCTAKNKVSAMVLWR